MLRQRKEILISAYAISPYMGSEYGVGWNFVTGLSEFYNITVLYGTSGERMGNNSGMTAYLKQPPANNVRFVFVEPNAVVRFFDRLNHRVSPIFFAFAYAAWQRQILARAKGLAKSTDFALAHHLNTIGFRQPGYLSRLGVPFVWGPVGGTSNLHSDYLGQLSAKNRLRHLIRNVSNLWFLKCSAHIRNTVRASAAIFMATSADQANFARYFGAQYPVVRENAVRNYAAHIKPTAATLVIIWVGRIDELKALHILINAVCSLPRHAEWELHVVGDGPLRAELFERCETAGVNSHIRWHGGVSHSEAVRIMQGADLNVMTSLMDSNPTVLLEAFECCVPTVAIDHFGMRDLIDVEVGFKLPVGDVVDTARRLAETINFCIGNHAALDALKRAILARQPSLHWDVSIATVRGIYEKVIADE